MAAADRTPDGRPAGPAGRPSVSELLAAIGRSVMGEARATAELVATEGRLAALSVAAMLALALAAVAFIVATWLALVGALAVWLVAIGWPAPLVLLGVAVANLLLVAIVALWIRSLSRNLLFERTRHRLKPGSESDAVVRSHRT